MVRRFLVIAVTTNFPKGSLPLIYPPKMKFSNIAIAAACLLASANGFATPKPTGFGLKVSSLARSFVAL
jgi:hypothetical protein